MYCKKCGKELRDIDNFCLGCGTKIERNTVSKKYCKKCGRELREQDFFCLGCGTKIENKVSTNSVLPTKNVTPVNTYQASDKQPYFFDEAKNKILTYANLVLLILSMVFMLTETFSASIPELDLIQRATMFGQEDYTVGFTAFFVGLYIVAIISMLVSIFNEKTKRLILFIFPKIATIVSSFWFIVFYVSVFSAYKSEDYKVQFGPTITGWLYLITTVGVLILSFKISHNLKLKKRSER